VAHAGLSARCAIASALAAAAAFAAVEREAWAYRPFDGTDAEVAEHGEFELELGPVQYFRLSDRNFLVAPSTVLNLGVLPRVELVVDFQQFIALDALGPGESRVRTSDTDVLMKYVIREGVLQDKEGLSIAAEAGPLLPDINGTNAFGASLDVITSARSSLGTLHLNVWPQYTREHNFSLFSGLIIEGPYDWVVRPVAELFVESEFNVGNTYSGLVGAIWTVQDTLAFDVGVRAASTNSVATGEVRLGFTWAVPVWDTKDAKEPAKVSARRRSD
jgi:hypothetical protein